MREIWPDYKVTKYLAAEELGGEEAVLTVAEVDEDEFEDDKNRDIIKAVLVFKEKFRGKDKRLALNATNRAILQDMFGRDVKNCIGQRITLYPTTTDYMGKVVPCIRIKEPPETDAG